MSLNFSCIEGDFAHKRIYDRTSNLDGDSFPTITHLNVRCVHVHLFVFAELQILFFFLFTDVVKVT